MRSVYKSLILGAFLSLSATSAFAAAAVIDAVTGPGAAPSVQVKRGGTNLSLKKGDELKPGDELTTDRAVAVDIRLEDRSVIRVGVNSSYRLEEDSAAKKLFHRLLSGIVRVLVPKGEKNGAIKFEMKTAEGTIGVRGTEFVVIREGGETQLKGLEGEVTFGSAGANFNETARFVPVRGGFESRVKAGAAVPAVATAFDLDAYLRTIDSTDGPFKGLAKRKGASAAKTRSAEPAKAPVVAAAPAASAPRVSMKAQLAKEVKKEAPKNDPNGKLFEAARRGDEKGMAEALKAGADVNKPFALGATALHAAVLSDKEDAVVFLIKKGAKVDARDQQGRTPLMTVASDGGKPSLVIALQESGAKQDLTDVDGKTALNLAEESLSLATEQDKKDMFQAIVDELREKEKK
jgi:hypothetical protein